MATNSQILLTLCCTLVLISSFLLPSHAEWLYPNFYERSCPEALPTITAVVENAIRRQPRLGASLLRLHFHDCFVNGCDGSVLLDDTDSFVGEKRAPPNNNSLRGFEVVDEIKYVLDKVCYGNVVSCADILAVAARDSVALLGGPSYEVLLGRRDARTASKDAATNSIPAPFQDVQNLIKKFNEQGLTLEDMVVLVGAHTLGFARCTTFRARLDINKASKENIDPEFAEDLRWSCPPKGGENNLVSLDGSPARFDTSYFRNLMYKKGVLHSDQQMFMGDRSASDGLVRYYRQNWRAFFADFGVAMIKMGNIRSLTGNQGEIRRDCRRVN